MTTDRELMQQALDALESSRVFVTTREKIKHPEGTEWYDERIEALRTALAQGEQDTECSYCNGSGCVACDARCLPQGEQGAGCISTYPPGITTREWQGLTDEEIFEAENSVPDEVIADRDWCVYFACAIEAKLKEKNT